MQVDTSLNANRTDLCIVVGANYLSPEIAGAIEFVQSHHTPCLLFSPIGHRILIGPLLVDPVNCWPCIRRRLAFQDPFYQFLAAAVGGFEYVVAASRVLRSFATFRFCKAGTRCDAVCAGA